MYGEQKRFTLKTPKPAPAPEPMAAPLAEPPSVPSPELPPSPTDDMGMGEMGAEDMGMDDMPMDDMEVEDIDVDNESEEGSDEMVTFKSIQKLTGKLTQKIRTLSNDEGMTSEDIKYVINMVLSSVDLSSLTEEDRDDILSKFEEDETEDFGQEDDMDGEDMTDDTEVEDIQMDMDVEPQGFGDMGDDEYGNGAIFDSIFGESQVDKVISKYFEHSKSEIREQKEKQVQKTLRKKSIVKNIMESVITMTETIEQEIAAEKFLNENVNSKFIGVTNKKNLVFETKRGQVKITPNGDLL